MGETYLVKKVSRSVSLAPNNTNLAEEVFNFEDISGVDEISCPDDAAAVINIDNNQQILNFEYHVLYQISYGVPYLSFNAYKSGIYLSSCIRCFH